MFHIFIRPDETAGWCSPGLECQGQIVIEVADTAEHAAQLAAAVTDARRPGARHDALAAALDVRAGIAAAASR